MIHFEKRNSLTKSFRLVSYESSDQISRQLLTLQRNAHSRANDVDCFMLLMFSQQFTRLGNHISSYVKTLKNLECQLLIET